MDKEFIERKTLLMDINESVVFSTRNGRSAEMRGAQKVVNRILEAPAVDVNKMDSPWFSVNDKEQLDKVLAEHKKKYPEENDVELLVIMDDIARTMMLFYDGVGFFCADPNGKCIYTKKITHWMPLPKPPKGVLKNEN